MFKFFIKLSVFGIPPNKQTDACPYEFKVFNAPIAGLKYPDLIILSATSFSAVLTLVIKYHSSH